MLLRKEKILMVPRGIPGSGKTNLGKLLSRTTAYMKNIQVLMVIIQSKQLLLLFLWQRLDYRI